MNYTVDTQKNWETTIHVTLSAEEIQAKNNAALTRVQKEVSLEGFRKGKVPTPLVKKLFSSSIQQEAVQLAIEDAWRTIFKENDFSLYNEPMMIDRKITAENGLTFDIRFEQRPQVTIDGFEDMKVEKIVWDVQEDDVNFVLEDLRQKHAMLYTIDSSAKEGDMVVADFHEVDASGVPLIGSRFDNQQIWLIPDDSELTPQLVGVQSGDIRTVHLQVNKQESEFVEQPYQKESSEKTYTVTVKEVKERRLPQLDDDFVKDLGGAFSTLADLRVQIENDLNHRAVHETEDGFEAALATELVKSVDLELPPSMVENYLDTIVDEAQKAQRDKSKAFDADQYRQLYRSRAIFEIKWHLISEQLIHQLEITATEQDVEAALERYHDHGESGEKRLAQIRRNPQEQNRLKNSIIFDKLYAQLAEKVDITTTTRPLSDLLKGQI